MLYYTIKWPRRQAYRKMQMDIADYEKRFGKIKL